MKVTSLDSRQLKPLLRKEAGRCLVLDCRPYLSYSASCLRGSLNVNLNSVVMRRARGRPVPLHFVVPDEAARRRLLLPDAGEGDGGAALRRLTAVVVLDQNTRHWRKLKKDSTAQIVLNTLLASLPEAGARVCFLKGERQADAAARRGRRAGQGRAGQGEAGRGAQDPGAWVQGSWRQWGLGGQLRHPRKSSGPALTRLAALGGRHSETQPNSSPQTFFFLN